jgi:hypothetical protein
MEHHFEGLIPIGLVVIIVALLVFVPGVADLGFLLRLLAVLLFLSFLSAAVLGVVLLVRYGHFASAVQRRKQKSYEPVTMVADDPDPDAEYRLDDDGELQKVASKRNL